MVALLLVIVFGTSATHAAALAEPTCAGQCPADCPMHTRLGCHHGPVTTASAKPHGCHRSSNDTPGLHAAGCSHQAKAAIAPDQPAILSAQLCTRVGPAFVGCSPTMVGVPVSGNLDPPYRPPAVTVFSLVC